MKCNQKTCDKDAVDRFTWPGEDEAGACEEHSKVLANIAEAMGLSLQLIPIEIIDETTIKGRLQKEANFLPQSHHMVPLFREAIIALAEIDIIKKLTTDELEAVTICAPNADFGSDNFAIFYACWIDFHLEDVRFGGDTLLDCLEQALVVKEKTK